MFSSSFPRLDRPKSALDRIKSRNAKAQAAKDKKTKAKADRKALKSLSALLSTPTRERLLSEATASPAFAGMEREEIHSFLDQKISDYLTVQPWWFGRTDDSKMHAQQRQYAVEHGLAEARPQSEGLAKYYAQQRQERHEREQRINERLMTGGAPHDHS